MGGAYVESYVYTILDTRIMKTKFPYGTTAQNNLITLPSGLLTVDTDKHAVRIHDGVTQGGFEVIGTRAYIPPPGSAWTLHTTSSFPNNNFVQGVAYGNGLFVAIGSDGKAASSTDGVNWTQRTTGFTDQLWSVAYGNGLWIIGGVAGIATSTDGINWTKRPGPLTNPNGTVAALCYANGIWVASGSSGWLSTSTNGTTWTVRPDILGGTGNPYCKAITYANGLFVAVGFGGKISTSTNGTTWTARTSNQTQDLNGAAYFNGLWVVISGSTAYSTSPDGTTWTPQTFAASMGLILATTTHFIVVYGGFAYMSTDGTNWTRYTMAVAFAPGGIAYSGSILVVTGNANSFGDKTLTSP